MQLQEFLVLCKHNFQIDKFTDRTESRTRLQTWYAVPLLTRPLEPQWHYHKNYNTISLTLSQVGAIYLSFRKASDQSTATITGQPKESRVSSSLSPTMNVGARSFRTSPINVKFIGIFFTIGDEPSCVTTWMANMCENRALAVWFSFGFVMQSTIRLRSLQHIFIEIVYHLQRSGFEGTSFFTARAKYSTFPNEIRSVSTYQFRWRQLHISIPPVSARLDRLRFH